MLLFLDYFTFALTVIDMWSQFKMVRVNNLFKGFFYFTFGYVWPVNVGMVLKKLNWW